MVREIKGMHVDVVLPRWLSGWKLDHNHKSYLLTPSQKHSNLVLEH